MTNGELAKELSQYPLTAIATGLLDVEKLKEHLATSKAHNFTTNPLQIPETERKKLFGERLKRMRKLRGLTRIEFATQLRVSTALVVAYESGKREPSVKNLIAMSQVLDVDTDWLLGLEHRLPEN